MWSNYDSSSNRAPSDAHDVTNESNEGRKAALVQEIEAFVRGERMREITARELAGMKGADRLLTLRKGKLISLYRTYRREGARTSLLPGVLDLISMFGDSDVDGFCWLSQDRIAMLLNTDRTSVLRALKEAERDGLVTKVAARPGFSNGYILAMPSAVADPKVSIFDLLNMLAPRTPEVLPHGRRREVRKNISGGNLSANFDECEPPAAASPPFNSRNSGRTPVSDRRDATVTTVGNRCYSRAVTDVTLELPDSSNDPSVEEEAFTYTGPQNFSFFDGAPIEVPDENSEQEVGPTPLPPPREAYATQVYATYADTTYKGQRSDGNATFAEVVATIPGDVVEGLAEVLAWAPPHQRTSAWSPRLDLGLAHKHLRNILASNTTADPSVREEAIREAVGALRSKIADADAVAARGEVITDANIVSKPIAYLGKVFKKRLREIPIERRKDELSKRNAAHAALVEAETNSKAGEMKIAALGVAIERKAATQQKIANGRVERAEASRQARGRAHAVITGEDSSKTFGPYAEVMTVHRSKIMGLDANAIMASVGEATIDDVYGALRLVEERDKPSSNGKSGYFDPMPTNKVIDLAKGYLQQIVLHRLRGAPESFIDGAVAYKSDFVAISRSWIDALKSRLPDLDHVKNVNDALNTLDVPSAIISNSRARTTFSVVEAVFRIASYRASSQLEKYGAELTRWVETEMEAHLSRINNLGRANREKSEAEKQRAKSFTPVSPAPRSFVTPASEWPSAYRERNATALAMSEEEGENEVIH